MFFALRPLTLFVDKRKEWHCKTTLTVSAFSGTIPGMHITEKKPNNVHLDHQAPVTMVSYQPAEGPRAANIYIAWAQGSGPTGSYVHGSMNLPIAAAQELYEALSVVLGMHDEEG